MINIEVKAVTSGDIMLSSVLTSQPDARVVPTPLSPQSVVMAASRLGSFLKAFLDSVWTARGVLIRTKLVSCG